MDIFLRVAQSGSFTVVSSQIGRSPAAVTRLINTLETRLGVRLLNRSTRSISLTDAGKTYAEMCERVIRDIAQCEVALTASEKGESGLIRVLVPQSFGARRLGDAIIEFCSKYPNISMSILLGSFSARTNEFVERECDVALHWGQPRESTLVGTKLGNQVRTLCASPEYLKKNGTPKTPEDLRRGHNCLVLSVAFPDGIWRFSDGENEIGVKATGDFSSDSSVMLYKATIAGRGLCALPHYVIRNELKSGTLVEVLPNYRLPTYPLFLLYRDKKLLPARVRFFIDFLRKWFIDQANSQDAELVLD
jgi:DNA-binding transcriptional LysR family regulator